MLDRERINSSSKEGQVVVEVGYIGRRRMGGTRLPSQFKL
jgi:hypothetical protein